MKRHLSFVGLLTLVGACAHEGNSPSSKSDGGTGLNTVERKYGRTASDIHQAALASFKSFDLTVDQDRHDAMGSEVVGHRADGHRVTVKVDAIDNDSSSASVRVEPGDSNMAQMIHEKIADKLGMGTATEAFFSANSETALYDADLETCLNTAERTAKALDWTVTRKDLRDGSAHLDARAPDSTPARFKIARIDDRSGKSGVTFIAGNGKTDLSKTMIARMHEEFDRQLGLHAR
jgi:hypothetical protein